MNVDCIVKRKTKAFTIVLSYLELYQPTLYGFAFYLMFIYSIFPIYLHLLTKKNKQYI